MVGIGTFWNFESTWSEYLIRLPSAIHLKLWQVSELSFRGLGGPLNCLLKTSNFFCWFCTAHHAWMHVEVKGSWLFAGGAIALGHERHSHSKHRTLTACMAADSMHMGNLSELDPEGYWCTWDVDMMAGCSACMAQGSNCPIGCDISTYTSHESNLISDHPVTLPRVIPGIIASLKLGVLVWVLQLPAMIL